jgi:hypothetical protein
MKIKTTLAALALTLAPGLALAEGCHGRTMSEVTASSCPDGQVWDTLMGRCVLTPTS